MECKGESLDVILYSTVPTSMSFHSNKEILTVMQHSTVTASSRSASPYFRFKQVDICLTRVLEDSLPDPTE